MLTQDPTKPKLRLTHSIYTYPSKRIVPKLSLQLLVIRLARRKGKEEKREIHYHFPCVWTDGYKWKEKLFLTHVWSQINEKKGNKVNSETMM